MLGGFTAVMVAVLAFVLFMPKTYESSASFLVEHQQTSRSEVSALAVLDRLGRLATRETEVALVRSRRVVEPVVDRGDLHVTVRTPNGDQRPSEVFTSFVAGSDARAGTYELSRDAGGRTTVVGRSGDTLATAAPAEHLYFGNVAVLFPVTDSAVTFRLTIIPFSQAVQEVQEQITVDAVQRDADLIGLTCEARTAEGAQWLCGALAQSYVTLRAELQKAEATAAAEFLADQADLVSQRLAAVEDSMRSYAQRARAVALGARAAEEVRQNTQLWASREQLRAERASLVALITQIEGDEARGSGKYRDLVSFPTFLKNQNQIVTELVANLVELDNRRNDLAVRRSDQDVELAALDQWIADTEGQIKAIAVGYEQALAAQITSLDEALENSGAVLAAIPLQQLETARLERQVSLLEDLYGFLQTRLQEAEIAQAVELPSVRVVDRASLPFEHSRPNEPIAFALGLLLASGFGLVLGLWRESVDTSVRERTAVEEETGIPVLSMIPALKKPGPVISVRVPATNGHKAAVVSPAWTAERQLALEAFRTLSADLRFLGRGGGKDVRSVAVTSAGREEGKTYTACNLAIARASHGVRTLLIDADLRARGVSRFLRIPLDVPGLTELMTSDTQVSRHVPILEVGSAGNPLCVLPAGAVTSHGAELLESDRFRTLLKKMEDRFDLVVIDTPPLNVVTDSAAIAARVQSVLLVVRAGRTDSTALEFTLERLERAGAHTVGIVLNDVNLPSSYRAYSRES